jgi:hypothetical protein
MSDDQLVYATRGVVTAQREVADAQREVAIATLTAGIIEARGKATVADIRAARLDAVFILYPPAPASALYAAYVEWMQHHGIPVAEVQPRVCAAE